MLNHWYHRGQLLVYLRMLNQSVRSVYGPTADENSFAARVAGLEGVASWRRASSFCRCPAC